MPRPGRILLTLASAALYTASFPPWNCEGLVWIALVPFLLALRGATLLRATLLGLLWGVAMIWGVGMWLPRALGDYYQQPLWFGLLFGAVSSVYFIGLYYAAFAASAVWISSGARGVARVLSLSVLWVAWELIRSRFLTGDPWLLIGYALAPRPLLMQAADLGGVYVLSFVVILVNAAVSEALTAARDGVSRWAPVGLAAAVVVADVLYGSLRLSMPLPLEPRVPVVVVQGNNDMGAQWRNEFYGQGLAEYIRLSYEAAPRDRHSLIVWPESAITFFVAEEPDYLHQVGRMLAAANADLILGGPYKDVGPEGERYYNSAFYVTADGRIADRYDKGHLLPFAEYFPLRTVEFLRRQFERVRYFTAGRGDDPLSTRFGDVATVICFEGMFPEIVAEQTRRGASLLLNLSNDAWLGRGAGPEQHLMMIPVRAVENRVWAIRATTTGISAIVDPYGRIVERSPLDQVSVLQSEVVPISIDTPYKSVGDLFAWICLGLSGMAALLRMFAGWSGSADGGRIAVHTNQRAQRTAP